MTQKKVPSQFSYPAQRRLKKRLGEVGALVELGELAQRRFVAEADRSGDVQRFVAAASDEFKVRVRAESLANLALHAAYGHIVVLQQEVELFLREFGEQHGRLFGTWAARAERESLQDWAICNVNAHAVPKVNAAIPSLLVADYYRLVRNWIVHPHLRVERTMERELGNVRKAQDDIQKYFGIPSEVAERCPGHFDALSFDDFVMFSRAAQAAAQELCLSALPSDKQLVPLAREAIGRVKKRVTRGPRVQEAAASELAAEFGVDRTRAGRIVAEAHGLGG